MSLKPARNTLLEEGLSKIKNEEPIIAEVVSYRLIIERLGEQDNNEWWESRILSEFGSDSMSEVTPRTASKRRVTLAHKVGKKVEEERLPEDAVSLFSLTPNTEARIENAVEETGVGELESLEKVDSEISETGWSSNLVPESSPEEVSLDSVELGEISPDSFESDTEIRSAVKSLVGGYGASTKNSLCVPYFTHG
jgi:hypothetical protein